MNKLPLTITDLKRYNNLVFLAKEVLEEKYSKEFEHITEALMLAFYGIDELILKLERHEQEQLHSQRA